MPHRDNVSGRLGDVSGRLGDVSGRLGDVSGRLGDVSGRLGDVSGRVGDVSGYLGNASGSATSDEVEDSLILDRQADRFSYTESRINRLESEIVLIIRWINARMMPSENPMSPDVRDALNEIDNNLNGLNERLTAVENRLNDLGEKPPTS